MTTGRGSIPQSLSFEDSLTDWSKRLNETLGFNETLDALIPQLETRLAEAETTLFRAQSPRAAMLSAPEGGAISFGPGRKEVEAGASFEFAQAQVRSALEEIDLNIFFADLYSVIPALVQSGAVNSVDEALAHLSLPLNLSEAILKTTKTEIGNLLMARDRGTTTAGFIEGIDVETTQSTDYPALKAPAQVTSIAPVSIHRLTTNELIKTYKFAEIPETQFQEEEYNAYLRDVEGWSEEDIENKDVIIVETIIADALNRKSLVDSFRNGQGELPARDAFDLFQQAVINPPLMALEALNWYYEHVSMPLAGWVYGKIPDIHKANLEFRAANPDATAREAAVYAWENWDNPGPPVLDFIFKYIIMEGIVDPLSWVGVGLVSKGLRIGNTTVGGLLARANFAVGEVLELPFDYIKWVGKEVFSKTILQKAGVLTRDGQQIVGKFLSDYTGVPVSRMKPSEMASGVEFAIGHHVKNPRAEDDVAMAAKQFLLHPNVGKDDAANWISRLRAQGATTHGIGDITDDMFVELDTIFERVFNHELTADEAAPLLLNKLGVEVGTDVTEDMSLLAAKFMADRSNKIADRAIDFTFEKNANKAMRALSRKNLRINELIESSTSLVAAKRSSRFQMLLYNIERGQIGAWTHAVNRAVIRPAAESYLTFGMYGPMNVFEDYFRSILGGVKPGRMSVEKWDVKIQGLKSDPMLRIGGLSENIGPLRDVGEAQRANWILTIALAPLSVPTWAATRGVQAVAPKAARRIAELGGRIIPKSVQQLAKGGATPVGFAKNTYSTLVELFGGIGIDVRRNFTAGKYEQLLADMGGDAFMKLNNAVPKTLPSALNDAPRWVKRNIISDLTNAAQSGKLTTNNPKLVQIIKNKYTRNKINRAEVNDIIMKYEDLSPTARSLTMDAFDDGRLLESPASVKESMSQILDAEVDDFLRGPEKAIVQYDELEKLLVGMEVTNPLEMKELLVSLNRMSSTYNMLPDQIIARATIKSRGLPIADRRLHFDTEFDRIARFLDTAGGSVENVITKIRGTTGFTPEYSSALDNYLNLVTAARKATSEAKLNDAAFRTAHFAGVTSKQMDAHFWDDFYNSELAFWKKHSKDMATLNSQMHRAIENINVASGIKEIPRPAVRVSGRPLAPTDVAKLMGTRGDDISKLLMDSILPEGDKDYFVEYVLGLVREGDVGFDRISVESVYDQIAQSMLIDPKESSWFRSRKIQIDAMEKDFHDLFNAKLFPEDQKLAVDRLVDDVAANVQDITRETTLATTDLGLAERLSFEGEILSPEDVARRTLEEEPRLVLTDTAKLEEIRGQLAELGSVTKTSGGDTLENVMQRWFATSDNSSLQLLGRTASDDAIYREGIQAILREQYPTGQIRLYRGSGLAGKQELPTAREFTNVTSSRQTAIEFQDTWGAAELVLQRKGKVPDIDNIIVNIEDIVAIGAVNESELIIPGKVLVERMKNPLQPVSQLRPEFTNFKIRETDKLGIRTGDEITVDYDGLRQAALDDATRWYHKEYPDYTNANAFDAAMKQIYPFWTYESQRWFWLPRSFIRHPGTLTTWGRWNNNTDNGYVHIPGTKIDVHPGRGNVYGAWSTRMMRRDYPEYYDQLDGFGGGVEFFDFLSRYGFYPNVIMGGLLAQFGGNTPQTGGILPSAASTPLNAAIAAFPDNPVITFISEKLFPNQFRQYLTARGVDDLGGDGSILYAKQQAGLELTPEEQDLWTTARQSVALHSAAFEQFGMFRMSSDERFQIREAATLFIEQTWGITAEQQTLAHRRGEKLWDMIGGLDPWESAVMQELEFFKYSGSINPVLPGQQQEILNRIELDWAAVREYSETMKVEILDLEEDFLTGSIRGRLGPTSFLARVRELQRGQAQFIEDKTDDNPLMLLENRTEYYEKYGQVMPTQSPYNELLSLFYAVELEDTVDENTGERILDWDKFWNHKDMITSAIPTEDRGQWDSWLDRNTAPIMKVWKTVNQTYFKKYNDLWDKVKQTYDEQEQLLIDEYLFLERTQQKLERQEQIRTVISNKTGKSLISGFRSEVSDERKALRFSNPHLDAWLFYWGKTTTFVSHEGEDVFRALSSRTGRTIE